MNKVELQKIKTEWALNYDSTWDKILNDFMWGNGVSKLFTFEEVMDFIAQKYADAQTSELKAEIERLKSELSIKNNTTITFSQLERKWCDCKHLEKSTAGFYCHGQCKH